METTHNGKNIHMDGAHGLKATQSNTFVDMFSCKKITMYSRWRHLANGNADLRYKTWPSLMMILPNDLT